MRARTILSLVSALAVLQFGAEVLEPATGFSSLFRGIEVGISPKDWDFRFGYGICAASFPLIQAIMLLQAGQSLRFGPLALRPVLATFALGNVIHCTLSIGYGVGVPVLFDLSGIVALAAAILALKPATGSDSDTTESTIEYFKPSQARDGVTPC